jgi:penicillin amidase
MLLAHTDETRLFEVLVSLSLLIVSAACRRQADAPQPPLAAVVSGTIEISGLGGPVRIVRDRWGIPHIYARTRDDLFFAQGFVQAEDRLFQMDLWRRSVQGRLSEVLGPNFIERDAMTRRVQYRGDIDREWAAYGPDTRAVATAFVRGINAWVELARERPPEAFVLAGWLPDMWSPADLINRTDAFLASGDAIDEIRRANLSDVIADAVRRVGTPPFFSGLAAPVAASADAPRRGDAVAPTGDAASTASGVSRATASRGGVLSVSEGTARFEVPARRYVVHLHAPGWNAIGVTRPWLPGIAIGHNDRIAWGMAPLAVDTQDVHVDASAAVQRTIVKETIVVKGRSKPFEFEIEQTPHGVVIASDRTHDRVFTLRWSGTEPGGAAELAAAGLNTASSWTDFRAALAQWRMPARRVIYADVDGNTGFQDAALVPLHEAHEWRGWMPAKDLAHRYNAPGLTATPDRHPAADDTAHDARFAHPLAITGPARERFDVGPVTRPADAATVRARFDPRDWDRSQVVVAPGQSESPDSPHFRDLAQIWSRGELVPLAFSDAAVQAQAASTLVLAPRSK